MIGDPIALTIRRNIERAPRPLVRAFAKAQTSFIADAQQGFNCLHYAIKPVTRKKTFAGTAVTAMNGPRDNLAAMAMLDVCRRGDVLVIATGEDESGAVVGDHWAAVAKQRGAVAVVTDGLVRDTTGIDKKGPVTFARGTSPNAGYRNGPGEVNSIVSVGGVTIAPGDILVGDRDGVVVVPRANAPAVKQALDAVIKAEARMEKLIDAGKKRDFWDPGQFGDRGVEYLD
jgi:4-hydroxy-4-methyl-2-oxoglutarate aldolase